MAPPVEKKSEDCRFLEFSLFFDHITYFLVRLFCTGKVRAFRFLAFLSCLSMIGLIGLENGKTVSGIVWDTAEIKSSSSEKSLFRSQISSASRASGSCIVISARGGGESGESEKMMIG